MGDSLVRALDGVDLTIERGEFVAITGASGSGKSTMMHLIGCLDRPTSGSYVLDGQAVGGLSDWKLAAIRNGRIGFVFQTFNLIQRTTALENVAVPLFYAGFSNPMAAAKRALERVGLGQRATHKPNELSGGERQRVAIARAIVNDPPLLLADEPTGNLDSRTGEQIMQVFHDLNAQGVTIVLVTHEHDVAMQARRIVQMRDGHIVFDRPTSAIPQEEFILRTGRGAAVGGGVRTGARMALVPAGGDAPSFQLPESGGPRTELAIPPEHADDSGHVQPRPLDDLPPERIPGATAALVWGILCAAIIGGLQLVALLVWRGMKQPEPGKPPTQEQMVMGLTSLGGVLAASVCGIVAVALALRGHFRTRKMKALWTGRPRLWIGFSLGAAGVSLIGFGVIMGIVKAVSALKSH